MHILAVIPARWGSTRFEGKILADILGKPMIQHVYERVVQSEKLDDVFIATDDKRILHACEKFGAKVVMTSADHVSGTDRIAEAIASVDVDYVINIQGDEPLIQPETIDKLADALAGHDMATVVKTLAEHEKENPHVVKAVVDDQGYAVCFSRNYPQDQKPEHVFKHIGMYGYKKDFLCRYKDLPVSENEQKDKLEQLRALDAGVQIKTIQTSMNTIGVDTPEDLQSVIAHLS